MSAQEFLSFLSQAIYLVLFVVASARFVRRPSWGSFDTFLFFGIIAVLLLAGDAARLFGFQDHPGLNTLNWIGVSALPFILVRLIDDLRPRPVWIMVIATGLFLAVASLGIVAPQPWRPPIQLVPVAYVVVFGLYASAAFLREGLANTGVVRWRMLAVALGSGLLAVVLLLAGVRVLIPELEDQIGIISQLAGIVLVLAYYVGFAPPALLRRAWQEPVLRALLVDAGELVQLPDARAVAERIEGRAAAASGADGAAVGLWDEGTGQLVFRRGSPDEIRMAPGEYIAGRAFAIGQAVFSGRAERDAPEHAERYRSSGIHAIAAAPIATGDQRIGVLAVYAARPPLFTDDVLSLITLIAEQAGVIFRSQHLLQEAAQVRAMAEVTRLKDDFLSVVAHDVRTPLTTILLNAELLERSLGSGSADARRAASLRSEAVRLKQLVEDYLDVVRMEHVRELRRDEHDLVALVRDALAGMGHDAGRVRLLADPSVTGTFDGSRITQLVQNLVSNGLKYSEPDQPVEVEVRADGDDAVLTVSDDGIGIPESDLAILFERFHRGTNTDDRRYAGLGLGLYICRQIAEEHGGSISVASRVGEGTTFTVRLARSTAPRPAATSPAPVEPTALHRPDASGAIEGAPG